VRSGLSTPVALLIFNRPETTARVFERVRGARPEHLLVVADGPRSHVDGEADLCERARTVTEAIDWPCDVTREYADSNLGCKRRVSSGVSWVFEQVQEAILLEDDCVPHPSFFPYCEELLDRYRADERVMHISGDNLGFGRRGNASYFFSRYPHVWGWASWRTAWRHYDPDLTEWSSSTDRDRFLSAFADSRERRFWRRAWSASATGEIDTWDYQWAFACVANGGLAVNPNVNLVSNIGFAEDSTHTQADTENLSNIPASEIELPLRHPVSTERDVECDARTAARFFTDPEDPASTGQPRFRAMAEKWLAPLRRR
jgi:hypothetical protein